MKRYLIGPDEIAVYFQEFLSPEKTMGKFQLARIYGKACREDERNEKEQKIQDAIHKSKNRYIEDIVLISEDIAIAKVVDRTKGGEEEACYMPILDGESLHEVSETFDTALVIALCHKYKHGSFVPAIYNMLRMDDLKKTE